MDEKIVKRYIEDMCKKYGLLHSNNKIVIAPDVEIRININTNHKKIFFYEYVLDNVFNHYSINYTINELYRCYNLLDNYKDFAELENAIEYCIKTIMEDYEKVFWGKK